MCELGHKTFVVSAEEQAFCTKCYDQAFEVAYRCNVMYYEAQIAINASTPTLRDNYLQMITKLRYVEF